MPPRIMPIGDGDCLWWFAHSFALRCFHGCWGTIRSMRRARSGVSNTLISVPISAIMTAAVSFFTPGMVMSSSTSSRWYVSSKRSMCCSISSIKRSNSSMCFYDRRMRRSSCSVKVRLRCREANREPLVFSFLSFRTGIHPIQPCPRILFRAAGRGCFFRKRQRCRR
ncbi:hypothetical protein PTHTG4_12460 [Parageobacillus thermoglucosidasius]|nr:hypothetical protein PTHTG4_12460 [Parageobacillus thermoglucosidasius]